MKRFTKFISLFFVFGFLFANLNVVNAGFSDYNARIITQGRQASDNSACTKTCPKDSNKYYQLTTGLPIFGSNAVKCACIPVSVGLSFFLNGVLTFVLGSIGTITVIIIIISGFRWAFSAGNSKIIEEARSAIMNAIIGLVMTLTCGLALQVVNPKLLQTNTLLNIASVTVESKPNTCGDITESMPRGSQVCRLDMSDNSFLTDGSKFSLKWKICDINDSNASCSDVQYITEDKKTWPRVDEKANINSVCTKINDRFGRFTIRIEDATGVPKRVKFICGTDVGGAENVYVESAKNGTYCLCKSRYYCIANDSDFCRINPTSDDCTADNIQQTSCFYKSILKGASGDFKSINTKIPFNFNCTPVDPEKYKSSDIQICNKAGSCTSIDYQQNYGSIDILAEPNMKFGIKVLKASKEELKLKCSVPYDRDKFSEITIPGNIIFKAGVGAVYDLCIGGHNECGIKDYDQVRFVNEDSYYSSSDISCDNLSGHHKSSGLCNNIKFNSYIHCYWDWNSNQCVNFDCGKFNNDKNKCDSYKSNCLWKDSVVFGDHCQTR